LKLVPVTLHHYDRLIDLRAAIIKLRDVRAIFPEIVPEFKMKSCGLLDMLRALSEAVFICKFSNYIHSTTAAMTISPRSITEVLAYLLIPVDQKLFIKGWIQESRRIKLSDSLLLLIHTIH